MISAVRATCPRCRTVGVLEVDELTKPIDTKTQAIARIEIKSGCTICGAMWNVDITELLRRTLSTEALEKMR